MNGFEMKRKIGRKAGMPAQLACCNRSYSVGTVRFGIIMSPESGVPQPMNIT